MTKGIYAYLDILKYKIIYVGKDSHIDENRRHKQHYQPSLISAQPINRILQNNNVGRYIYGVLEQGNYTNKELNEMEKYWIKYFNPKFNFTEGGDGAGSGENNPMYRKKHTKEARKKISEANSGENHPMYGVHRYGEKNPNSKYQNAFWNINNVKYHKPSMFQNRNSGLNPKKCFRLRYKGKTLNIGYFHEWVSVEIIAQKINKYQGEKDGR